MTTNTVHKNVVKFLELLGQAAAVDANSPLLTSWDTSPAIGENDNEVVKFSWKDSDSQGFSCVLTEEGIANGEWKGTSFFCNDHEGDEVQISLFTLQSIVPN